MSNGVAIRLPASDLVSGTVPYVLHARIAAGAAYPVVAEVRIRRAEPGVPPAPIEARRELSRPQGTAAVAVRLVVSGPDGQGPGGVRSLLDESFEVIGVGGQLLNVDSSARVRATSSESADGMRLVIESDRLLQWVCVDAPGWSPEDNYFHVLPGVPRTLTLVPLVLGTSRGKPRIKPANTPGSIPIESHRDAS